MNMFTMFLKKEQNLKCQILMKGKDALIQISTFKTENGFNIECDMITMHLTFDQLLDLYSKMSIEMDKFGV